MLEKHEQADKTIKSEELEEISPNTVTTAMPLVEAAVAPTAVESLQILETKVKAEELAAKLEARKAAALEARLALRQIRVLALKNFQEAKVNAVQSLRTALELKRGFCAWRDYTEANCSALRNLTVSLWRPATRRSREIRMLLKKPNFKKAGIAKKGLHGHVGKRERRLKQRRILHRLFRRGISSIVVPAVLAVRARSGYKSKRLPRRIKRIFRRKKNRLYFRLRKFFRRARRAVKRLRKRPIAFLSKYNLYNYFPAKRQRLVGSKKVSAIVKKSSKQWTHKITIKMTANNIFCALVDQTVPGGKVLQEVSTGRYKIKITKKRLKHQYKTFLQKFFARIWPQLGVGGLMVFITAPVRLRKKIILLLLNLRVCRFKSKKKLKLRAIFIKVHRKKCFNGCQSAKRRRKKRKAMRILK